MSKTLTSTDYALLSLDAYQNKSLIPSSSITQVQSSDSLNTRDNFFARSYTISASDSSETVVAYRGTDDWRDALTGDATGLGFSSYQSVDAAQFLRQITQKYGTANLTLTGHSLGGGLAGLMSALYGFHSFVIDSMPYEAAAAAIIANSQYALNNPGSVSPALVGDAGQLSDYFTSMGVTPVPTTPFTLTVSGSAVLGELLTAARALALQSWTPKALVTGLTAIESPIDLHEPSLAVLYSYGNDFFPLNSLGLPEWANDGNDLFSSLFDSSLATAAGITQGASADRTLRTDIAYSILGPSDALSDGAAGTFGDTAIASLFADVTKIGQDIDDGHLSPYFQSNEQALTDIAVAYAATLALQANVDQSRTSGNLSWSKASDIIGVDVRSLDWGTGSEWPGSSSDVTTLESTALAAMSSAVPDVTALYNFLWNVAATPAIDEIYIDPNNDPGFASLPGLPSWAAARTALVVEGDGNRELDIGNSLNTIVKIGAGTDTVWGGVGSDLFLAGTGNDTIFPGGGNNVVVGGDGTTIVDYRYASAGIGFDSASGPAFGQKNSIYIEQNGSGGSDELVGVSEVIGSEFNDYISLSNSATGDGLSGLSVLDGAGGVNSLDLKGFANDVGMSFGWNPAGAVTGTLNVNIVNKVLNGESYPSILNFEIVRLPNYDNAINISADDHSASDAKPLFLEAGNAGGTFNINESGNAAPVAIIGGASLIKVNVNAPAAASGEGLDPVASQANSNEPIVIYGGAGGADVNITGEVRVAFLSNFDASVLEKTDLGSLADAVQAQGTGPLVIIVDPNANDKLSIDGKTLTGGQIWTYDSKIEPNGSGPGYVYGTASDVTWSWDGTGSGGGGQSLFNVSVTPWKVSDDDEPGSTVWLNDFVNGFDGIQNYLGYHAYDLSRVQPLDEGLLKPLSDDRTEALPVPGSAGGQSANPTPPPTPAPPFQAPVVPAAPILGSPSDTSLVGTIGPDTFDSKGSATYEQGNGGTDIFLYNAGYGQLEINEDAGFATSDEAVLKLGAGILPSQLVASYSMAGDILLTDGVTGDEVSLDNEYGVAYNGAYGLGYNGANEYGVSSVLFNDGTSLSRQQLINLAATGSATNTKVYGSSGADTLDSKGLASYAQGNGGADTFIYNAGYGALEINEYASFAANTTAVLQVGGGLTAADFAATFDGSGDVTLTDGVTGDQIEINGEVLLGDGGVMSSGVTTIEFADGTSITQARLEQELVIGSATNTRIVDTAGVRTIDSKGFASYVQGSGGADTFIYNAGYGALEINEYASSEANTTAVLQVGGGLTAADFAATFDGSGEVTLTNGVTGDQIKIDGEVSLGYGGVMSSGVTNVEFADGTSITQARLEQELVIGSATNTRIVDTAGVRTIDSKGFASYVQGSGGADTFVYNAGYGALEINEYASSGANTTAVLQVGGGLTAADFAATFDGSGEVTLTNGVTGDQIKIDGEVSLGYGGVMSSGVTTVEFADGTSITQARLEQELVIGSATNTRIVDTAGVRTIDSKGFASYVQGSGGADTFIYNAGYGALEINEYASSEANTTAVLQVGGGLTAADFAATFDGSGEVTLTNGVTGDQIKIDGEVSLGYGGVMSSGVTTVEFADGTSITQARLEQELVIGSATNTRIVDTAGVRTIDSKGFASYVQGSGGADTFIYNAGYGALEINEDVGTGGLSAAVLQFGAGTTQANLRVSQDAAGDLLLSDATTGDVVKLDQMIDSTEFGVGSATFADGTSLTRAQLIAVARPDVIVGSAGNTSLYGTSGADTFDSKGFATVEHGNGGADTFVYNSGYGALEIDENAGSAASSTAVIQLGPGITQASLKASQDDAGDLLLTGLATGDQIKLDRMIGSAEFGVGSVTFSDGTSLTRAQLIALATSSAIMGSATNTSLVGTNGADTFDSKGFATYEQGNGGADTFLYNSGYGQLEINEDAGFGTSSLAVLKLGAGISPSQLVVSNSMAGGIILTDAVTGDKVTLDNEYSFGYNNATEYGVSSVMFSDGTSLSRQQLINLAATGSTTNTQLHGSGGADTFDSKGFATYAQGYGGADTFIYKSGYGAFEINEYAGFGAATTAVLQVGGSLTAADFAATFDGAGDVTLTDGVTGDQIKIDGEVSLGYGGVMSSGVTTIAFADGASITQAQLKQESVTGSATNTRIVDTAGVQTIDSKGFASYVQGSGGADTFVYNSGYGALEIYEYAGFGARGTAVLQVGGGLTAAHVAAIFDGSGEATLTDGVTGDQIKIDGEVSLGYGNVMSSGVTTIAFADGASITQAQLEQESVTGSATNTRIVDTVGVQTIDPKGFASYVQGSGGADTFVYHSGYGALEIYEYAGFGARATAVLQVGGDLTAAHFAATFDGSGEATLTDGVAGDLIKIDGEVSLGYGNVMSSGVTTIAFADGTSITQAQLEQESVTGSATNTRIIDTVGVQTIDSKGFASYVQGSGGADTFVYNSGYGALEINESAGFGASSTALLHLGPGITSANLGVSSDAAGDLILTDATTGDRIKIDGEFDLGYNAATTWGVKSVELADGTSLSLQQLQAMSLIGSPTNTTLYGTSGADLIDSKGFATAEHGNGGADTFVYSSGYGALEIDENAGSGAASGAVLQLGAGITRAGLVVWSDADGDVVLRDGITGDSVGLQSMTRSAEFGVTSALFSDGTVMTRDQLVSLALANPFPQYGGYAGSGGGGGNGAVVSGSGSLHGAVQTIVGTSGIASLFGTSGADTFDSKGLATLEQGYGGADTFIYQSGYGQLEINENNGGFSSSAVVRFGSGITAANLDVTNDGAGGLYLADGMSGDSIRLDNEMGLNSGVEAVNFADGSSLTRQQLIDLNCIGTPTVTKLYGSSFADTFDSKGFATYEQGYGGADTFLYNSGYGQLEINEDAGFGTSSLAVLKLGAGISPSQLVVSNSMAGGIILTDAVTADKVTLDNEYSFGYNNATEYGVSSVMFSDGTSLSRQQLINLAATGSTTNTQLHGSGGADTFDSKGFATYAQGYGGADTFIYKSDYGAFEINEYAGFGAATTAVLQIGGSLTAADFAATFDGAGNATLTDGVAGDQIKIDGEVSLGYGSVMSSGVTTIAFADGTSITQAQLEQESVTGSATNTRIIDTVGVQTIDSKGFATYVQGSGGADTFVYNSGYGALEINENAGFGASSTAVLRLGQGITSANLGVSSNAAGDLILTSPTTGDRVKIDGEFDVGYNAATTWGVKAVQLADGTSLSLQQLQAMSLIGSPANTAIYGTSGAELIDSKGFATAEHGNGGADTFVYSPGYGALEIDEDAGSGTASGAVLQLGSGITSANLKASQNNAGDVFLTDATTGDLVKLDRMIGSAEFGVGSVTFSDGTSLTRAQLIALAQSSAITGSATNTSLVGTNGADTFDSKGFATYEQGNGGADTFLYNSGYGQLEINEDAGFGISSLAVLKLGAGISPSQLVVSNSMAGGIILTDAVTGDKVTLDNEYSFGYNNATEYGVSSVMFSDGTSLSRQQLINLAATGSTTNTQLHGSGGADTFDSKGFATYAQGYGGADTFIYKSGYGAFEINEYAGFGAATTAVLQVGGGLTAAHVAATFDGSGEATLTDGVTGDQIKIDGEVSLGYGNVMSSGVTTIAFADGASITQAQLEQESVTGSATNTRIVDTVGVQTIDPKGFASYVQGSGGADTFVYHSGYGALEIYEYAGFGARATAVLQVGGDLTAAHFAATFDGSGEATLTDGVAGDLIKIDGEVSLGYGNVMSSGVTTIAFADGASITQAQLEQESVTGSATNTRIVDTVGVQTIDPKGFASYVQGSGGADTFVYHSGYGALEIYEYAGFGARATAVLQVGGDLTAAHFAATFDGSGEATLTDGVAGDLIKIDGEVSLGYGNVMSSGVTTIAFADGTSITQAQLEQESVTGSATNTRIIDTVGVQTIDSKGFASYVQGSGGADTFVYHSGYGALEIYESAGFGASSTALLHLGPGITSANLGVSSDAAGDLILTDATTGDRIKIDGEFDLGYNAATTWGVKSVELADGTSLSLQQLQAMSLIGSPTNKTLYGTSGADLIDSKGFATAEHGNGGADTFVYSSGYGALEIDDFGPGDSTAHGVLQIGGSLTSANLWFEQSGNDLIVDSVGTHDNIDLHNWYNGPSSQLSQFVLADGTALSSADVAPLVQAMAQFSASSPGFNPITATQMPSDHGVQTAIAAAWHR